MSKVEELDDAKGFARTNLLFKWLKDESDRAELYTELAASRQLLRFQSRADAKEKETDFSVFHQEVVLVANPVDIRDALTSAAFGNAPYRKLGSGTFMLGLDGPEHESQRKFAQQLLSPSDTEKAAFTAQIAVLAALAWRAGSVQPLKSRHFDVADLAEQVALRFAGFLFGFALSDHGLLEQTLRKAYRGLNYQILGRHFVSEPLVVAEASGAMGSLLARTAALLDLYCQADANQADDLDRLNTELREVKQATKEAAKREAFPAEKQALIAQAVDAFVPLLRRMARADTELQSGNERAVIAVGLLVGMIGNIQAAVCTLVESSFQGSMNESGATGHVSAANDPGAAAAEAMKILRRRPAAAFLPREALKDDPFFVERDHATEEARKFKKGTLFVLAMGAAAGDQTFDPVFADKSSHSCIGAHLALPVILQTVQQILALPGLAQTIDAKTGETNPLKKLWGFKCESFPLEFDREAALVQHPLHVVMRVKTPVALHAEQLKLIIKYGAPRIESKLVESRHVHFAWFQFQENDSKLALMTVYDGEFDAYVEHFARRIGPLFDLLFAHIEDAPPQPTSRFPIEFVNTIRRYNVAPVGGYFFSAYPSTTTDGVLQLLKAAQPQGGR